MRRLSYLKNPIKSAFNGLSPTVALRFSLNNIFLFPIRLLRMRITLNLHDFDGTRPGDPLAKDGVNILDPLNIPLKFGPYPPDSNAEMASRRPPLNLATVLNKTKLANATFSDPSASTD